MRWPIEIAAPSTAYDKAALRPAGPQEALSMQCGHSSRLARRAKLAEQGRDAKRSLMCALAAGQEHIKHSVARVPVPEIAERPR